MTERPQLRIYSLDWLRALGMICVFLLHTCHIFDDAEDWYIKNGELSFPFTALMGFIHFWIMPLFFLLAGMGSELALRTASPVDYLRKRALRLLLPFLTGFLLLNPPQRYFAEVFHGSFSGSFLSYIPIYFATTDYRPGPDFFGNLGGHLWFLGVLFAFSLLCLPLFTWMVRTGPRRAMSKAAGFLGRGFWIILPAALPGAVQALLRPAFPGYGNWADVACWFLFVLLGFFIGVNPTLADSLRRNHRLLFFAGLAGLGGILALNAFVGVKACFLTGGVTVACTAFNALTGTVAWFLTASFAGAGMAYLERPGRLPAYAQEAVLPFYVVHQPILVAAGFYVIQTALPVPVKLLLIGVPSFLASAAAYELLIRRFRVLRLLFGLRLAPIRRRPGRA